MVWRTVSSVITGTASSAGGDDWNKIMNLFNGLADIDSVSINSDWTHQKKLILNKNSEATSAEDLLELKVSDATNSVLKLSNFTITNSVFSPRIFSYNATAGATDPGLTIDAQIAEAQDTGTTPILQFRAMRSAGTAIATRPLFAFTDYTNSTKLQIDATLINFLDMELRKAKLMWIKAISTPGNPDSGYVTLFVDTADGKIKVKKSSGTVVSLEEFTGNIDSLTDVIITSPSNTQILQYNGTNWVNAPAGSPGAHKDSHKSGGADAFVKGDDLIAAARYLEDVADPGSDAQRIWLEDATANLKYWSDETTPVKHTVEIQANKGSASGYAPLDSGSKVPLANLGGISNAQISATAAIDYSKLNVTGSILNADLAGSIAHAKLLQITDKAKLHSGLFYGDQHNTLNNAISILGRNSDNTESANLINLQADDFIVIGQNNLGVGTIAGIKMAPGLSTSTFELNRNGHLRCGGTSKRVVFTDSGLTDDRIFNFPDRPTKLLGFYDAPPMGYTDYQSGQCIGGTMADLWGEGLLTQMTTYGATKGEDQTSLGATRWAGTGTVTDTRAGEKSTNLITRRSCNPILWARVSLSSANTDCRWFMGFANVTDIPVNSDIPLANTNGFGFCIDEGATNGALEFHKNNGAATSTDLTIINATTGLSSMVDTFAYFYLECDDRNDQFIYKVWIGTDSASPIGTPTHSGTTDFTGGPSSTAELRYHNVINNESAVNMEIAIADVHILNRPTYNVLSNSW